VLSASKTIVGSVDRVDAVRALADRLNLLVPEPVLQQIKTEGQFPPNLQLHSTAKDALK
jgi:hypothetical protein